MRAANLVLALVSTAVAAAVIEGGARLVYEPPWFATLAQSVRNADFSGYRKNADGLRDRDYGRKAPGARRVLVLGDSFTYGSGVADEAAPFPRVIERTLGVEVLNGGLPASLPGQWLRLWRGAGRRFEPDAVVIVFFLRDGTRISSRGMFDEIRADFARAHAADPWYDRSYAYRLVRDRLDRQALGTYYAARFHEAYFGTPDQTVEWQRAQSDLRTLVGEVRAAGIPVGLVIFPVLIDLTDDAYGFQDIMDVLAGFGAGEKVPTFSLLPAFRGQHGPDLWVSDSDQHPNASGHAITGAALAPFVTELLRTAVSAAQNP